MRVDSFIFNKIDFKIIMAKVYIFTDKDKEEEYSGEIFDSFLSDNYSGRVFILSEDNSNIFMSEDGEALFIQEYFE